MSTTTPDEGATTVAQPDETAVTQPGDMIISQDESGTPTLVPVSEEVKEPEQPSTSEPTSEEPVGAPAEADTEEQVAKTPEEIAEWIKKSKGIEIDPTNEKEVKLAQMQYGAERKMHQATQEAKRIAPPDLLPDSEDPSLNAIVERQNKIETVNYVNTWFDANPEMKDYRAELTRIASERPYLTDMDDVAGHLYRDPNYASKLRNEGGKRALQNLAQKQSAIPPVSAATNSGFSSGKLTLQNLDARVKDMSPEEYRKNLPEINALLQG